MPVQPGQHGEYVLSQYRIHEGFLPDERFGRAARWKRVARVQRSFCDLREQLIDAGQTSRPAFTVGPQGFAQDKLAGVGVIAGVEPIMKPTRFEPDNSRQSGSRRPRIDATQ